MNPAGVWVRAEVSVTCRDCRDVVTQLAAVSKALDRAGFALIASGLRDCLTSRDSTGIDIVEMERLFLSLA